MLYSARSSWSFARIVRKSRGRTWLASTKSLSSAAATAETTQARAATVAVVGSGAVGAYYGARLWEQGHSVKFLFRGENYDAAKSHGLNVTSVYGDLYIDPQELQAFETTQDMGTVDWVIVALKSSSLKAIPQLIQPLLDPTKTRVLVIMNGLIEEDLIRMLQETTGQESSGPLECCQALYGGMALVCCNRLGPGRIDHSYAGLLSGGVAISSTNLSAEENKQAFDDLWEQANVDIAFEPSLLAGRWRKVRKNNIHDSCRIFMAV